MDITRIHNDLEILLWHVHVHPEALVQRWSGVTCEDPQVPISLLLRFLKEAVPPFNEEYLRLRETPEYHATIGLVANSSLDNIIVYDPIQNVIKYRESVSNEMKEDLARFLYSHATPLVTIREQQDDGEPVEKNLRQTRGGR